MTSTSLFPRSTKKPANKATTLANNIADMNLVIHNAKGTSIYYREIDTPTRIIATVYPLKEGFVLTIKSHEVKPGKTPGKDVLVPKETFHYPIRNIKTYHAEAALHLGLNPAHLETKPESVGEYLQGFNADSTVLHMYEDLGMVPEDAAKAIRMQQQMAESGQGDAQASTDYLADMSGYDFTMALDDDNTLAAGQDFTR